MRTKLKVLIVCGGVIASLAAGGGIASAQSDLTPVINSTCTYPQVIAALNAQDPAAAKQLTSSPVFVGWLKGFIGAGPAERQQMAAQVQNAPGSEQYTALVLQVANTCANF